MPDAQVCQFAQRPPADPAVAAVQGVQCGQQLFLRLAPAADRNQQAAEVGAADRRDEVAPSTEPAGHRNPLLRAGHVARRLACAEQAAIDVADGNHAHNLARGDRCHRLVEELHSFADATGGHVRLAEQRERVVLEIHVTEAPRDRQRHRGELMALFGIIGERGTVEHEPAVAGTLLHVLEQRCGASIHPLATAMLPLIAPCRNASQRARSAASTSIPPADKPQRRARSLRSRADTPAESGALARARRASRRSPGTHRPSRNRNEQPSQSASASAFQPSRIRSSATRPSIAAIITPQGVAVGDCRRHVTFPNTDGAEEYLLWKTSLWQRTVANRGHSAERRPRNRACGKNHTGSVDL